MWAGALLVPHGPLGMLPWGGATGHLQPPRPPVPSGACWALPEASACAGLVGGGPSGWAPRLPGSRALWRSLWTCASSLLGLAARLLGAPLLLWERVGMERRPRAWEGAGLGLRATRWGPAATECRSSHFLLGVQGPRHGP